MPVRVSPRTMPRILRKTLEMLRMASTFAEKDHPMNQKPQVEAAQKEAQ